jgi:hypothetical protein
MNAYGYDPVTKVYTGEVFCQESPLEPGVYLIPAHATTTAPPALGENEAAVFENGAWKVVADYRGTTIYSKSDSRITGTVEELGSDLPEGWTMVAPPEGDKRYVMGSGGTWQEYQKTLDELAAEYDAAMEGYLVEARSLRGYTTREPSDYFNSTVERWRQDAADWIAFRDAVMTYAIGVRNDVLSGGVVPTLDEFMSGMPVITWTIE